ncbi:hypothetical protein G6F60_015248 [Rhizopus arrhizus]|nr:hypothetical protein G6F60_015248 [Rhizopus arrhizus]
MEAHPITQEDLSALLARYTPEPFAVLAQRLAAQWPVLLPGLHRLEFENGAVTLTLCFGRAQVLAPRLSARVDAFFLDGFAPDRNPDNSTEPLQRT